MNRISRNYLLDMALFLLLGINVISLTGTRAESSPGTSPAHIISSVLLTLGCLAHIIWHWEWFRAVLTGRIRGKIKLGMNSMVTVMILLAGISGFAAQTSSAMDRFHDAVGSVALLGLIIHSVKHLYWMIATTKRLVNGKESRKTNWSTRRLY
jgi:hypothetical protein